MFLVAKHLCEGVWNWK